MARPLRLEFPGAIYYVMSRGNHDQPVFLSDDHREAFLDILDSTVRRFNWVCHAYCLMNSHYHLIIETPDGNLSKGMRQVNSVYTQYFNRTEKKSGHLFQGRFKSVLVEKGPDLRDVIRYLLLDPLREGIVNEIEMYAWSSYRSTCGMELPHKCLDMKRVLELFEGEDAAGFFREYVLAGMQGENPLRRVKGQVVLGSQDFCTKLEPLLKSHMDVKEIPVSQRLVNRPELAALFESRLELERDTRILEAVERWGYSQKEIADFLRLHYSSISRILKKCSTLQAAMQRTRAEEAFIKTVEPSREKKRRVATDSSKKEKGEKDQGREKVTSDQLSLF